MTTTAAIPRTAGETDDAPLVEFAGITKRFGAAVALDDVTLTIPEGQFVVLLGPSGSGKTTLLRCAAGIERITTGRITLAGRVVDDGQTQVSPERRDLAMVFQDYALWPHMTARENVRYALRRRRLPPSDADARTGEMLGKVGLEAFGGRYPSELSGGQQQRVALARALVARPHLLLFDEPLSNLDSNLRERMRIEIATLVREVGTTALYITHDQAEAFALADKIGVLENGRLVQLGTPEAIYGDPATPFVARLTGLAGELVGRVVGATTETRTAIAVGETVIVARTVAPLVPASGVRVLVRPAAVRFAAHDDGAVRCVVRDVAFSGRGYEHVVELAGGERLTGVFAEQRHERGEQAGIDLDAERCLIYPERD